MEFANETSDPRNRRLTALLPPKFTIEPAQKSDSDHLQTLIQEAFFRHTHADWYDPLFWLTEPQSVTLTSRQKGRLIGCLVAAADPPPAAWIRAAAFDYTRLSRQQIRDQFVAMIEIAGWELAKQGITELCWMSPRRWAEPWLVDAGFRLHTTMITYRKEGLDIPSPSSRPEEMTIRPVLPEDMSRLEAIEAATYTPLWRHSARGLYRAWREALSFDVVLWEGEVVGFQHSTRAGSEDAHLARISIHPAYQGRGIGSQLLARAITLYRQAGIKTVTLNTQTENESAQKMYRRFGFSPTQYRWPLSTLALVNN